MQQPSGLAILIAGVINFVTLGCLAGFFIWAAGLYPFMTGFWIGGVAQVLTSFCVAAVYSPHQ